MKKIIGIFIVLSASLTHALTIQECVGVSGEEWSNWSKNVICNPDKLFYPQTLDQVKAIISDANNKKISVRAVGSGHSMNALACSQDYLIDTTAFNQVLHVDPVAKTIKVECGIKLHDLYRVLKHNGLALKNQGFIDDQSIVGALSTGTHGTGKTGIMSDFIVAVELIDAQGNLITISKDSNPEMLPYARLSLGALGFIYSVTLQCVPLFVLKHKKKVYTWPYIVENYQELFEKNDYFMAMGHPISDKALGYIWNHTSKSPTHHYDLKITQKLQRNKYFNYLSAKLPHWAPGLTNIFFEHFFTISAHRTIREYGYKTLSPISNAHSIDNYAEEEIAVPVEHFPRAVKSFFKLYHKFKAQYPEFELVGMFLFRFVKGSTLSALSPAYGRDSVYLSFNTLSRFPHFEEFYRKYEAKLMRYGGRPHWGKFNFLDQAKVKELYGERVDEFNKLRAQLDPNGIFSNEYIERLFGN